MKTRKMWAFTVVLLLLAAGLVSTLHPDRVVPGKKQYIDNFEFKKIQVYLDDSAKYFRAIDSVYSSLPPAISRFEILGCKRGYHFTYRRDFRRSLAYTDSMLLTLRDLTDHEAYYHLTSRALFYKGDDLHALGKFSESFRYYYKAREAIFKTGDSSLFSEFSARLGMVAYQQKKFAEAAELFKQAFKQLSLFNLSDGGTEHMNFSKKQSYLSNVGLCYSKMHRSDSAVQYFDSALNFIQQHIHLAYRYWENNKVMDTVLIESAIGVIQGNMATELLRLGQDSIAEAMLLNSILMNSRPRRANEDVAYSQAKLAAFYLTNKRLPEAASVLEDMKRMLDKIPNSDLLVRWYGLRAEYEERRQQTSLAYALLKEQNRLKDSLDNIRQNILNSDIDKEFAYLDNENQITALEAESKERDVYMISAFIGLILLAIVALLILNNYRQSKKHVETLTSLNTELSEKESKLKLTLHDLQKSHERNHRTMKVVTHDLRNPLGGISGISGLMLKENSISSKQREMLQMIEKSSNHALELIEDLAHIHHSGDVQVEPIDVAKLLQFCAELMQVKADEKHQHILIHPTAGSIAGNKEKLWRVFCNLIGNAVKFSPENARIAISVKKEKANFIFRISDQGIGMPREMVDNIFDGGDSSRRKGTNGEPSFGLGLSICRQIVEEHNGLIWVESEENRGSDFYVSLPIAS